jgi:hypothetical protein
MQAPSSVLAPYTAVSPSHSTDPDGFVSDYPGAPVHAYAAHTLLVAGHGVSPPNSAPSPPGATTPLPTNADGFVSISTAFYPGALVDAFPADTVLVSADAVVFFAHAHRLLAASTNGFGGLLFVLGARPIDVAAHSSALNIAAHAMYDLPFAQFSPPFDDLRGALGVLALVGALGCGALAPAGVLTPDGALYAALLAQAPLRPLDVYALAGAHKLAALATATSVHLHTLPLASLTDGACASMGAVYLKKLFFLHLGRADALKRLLGTAPQTHAPVLGCSFVAQQDVACAWARAAAYLSWTARADLGTAEIADAFAPLVGELGCADCRAALAGRVGELMRDWALVKVRVPMPTAGRRGKPLTPPMCADDDMTFLGVRAFTTLPSCRSRPRSSSIVHLSPVPLAFMHTHLCVQRQTRHDDVLKCLLTSARLGLQPSPFSHDDVRTAVTHIHVHETSLSYQTETKSYSWQVKQVESRAMTSYGRFRPYLHLQLT